ncbi:MAG: nitrogen regulation protein NR(II) [Candidatus Methylomirabilia bacterium]
MFRPAQERSLLGYVPLRLVLSVFILFALLLAMAVAVGMQYERHALMSAGDARTAERVAQGVVVGLTWPDLLTVFGILLLLAAAAILIFTTFQNYRAITQTFERVKTLMRNILQSIPSGVLTLDAQSMVTSLNSAAERLLGLRAAMVVGRPVDDLLRTAPDLGAWIRSALAGERLLQEADFPLIGDGGRRVTLRASASELRDESGRSDGLVILLRDITEVSRLELQLRRADKLAALGTLAAGVAHEVKNPLHSLTLNLHLLEKEFAASEHSAGEAKGYLDILRSEVQRIHRIVENFLRFSRPSVPEVKPLDLNALVERVLSLVAFEAADRGVTIETHFDSALGSVSGDEGQLAQVFLNLAINALQAMPSGGTLTVTTERQNGWAEVAVKDTGGGIREELLPHVFDPYFTTRPGGVGLGLAIAHRIVEGHQGTIDVESKVGAGTGIVVSLPLTWRPSPAGNER